jgi:replicative DNA helicase
MDEAPPYPDEDPFGPPPAPARAPARATSRVPPHNIAAEESLLGAMLLSKDAIADAIEIIETADFYKPAHQHVYEAITSLYSVGEPADTVTVAAELDRAGLLAGMGGGGSLVTLQAGTPAATNASKYAKIVHEHSLLRRLIHVGTDIAEIGYSQPDDVVKAIDSAETQVFNLSQGRAADTLAPIRDLLDANLDRLEQLYEQGDTITGTPTGFLDLDELLSGLQPSSLVVVGARPAMGKTSFALNLVAHAAMTAERPVLFFSLEMSQLEISQRLLCAEARVDATRVRNGKLSEDDWSRISHGVGRLAEAPVWIDDNPQITVMEIRAKARRLKSRVGDLSMVVVDYLQLMTGRNGAESRQVEVAEISRGLKILARELECPVVALSQLSRQLEQRQDKRPMLSDLRESGSIEQDADVVMFLYRDEVYDADSPDIGTAEILVAKHRAGPTGMVRVAFLPHFTRFANMARGAG